MLARLTCCSRVLVRVHESLVSGTSVSCATTRWAEVRVSLKADSPLVFALLLTRALGHCCNQCLSFVTLDCCLLDKQCYSYTRYTKLGHLLQGIHVGLSFSHIVFARSRFVGCFGSCLLSRHTVSVAQLIDSRLTLLSPRLSRCLLNRVKPKGLVKMSAILSTPGVGISDACMLSSHWRRKWKRRAICLVMPQFTGFCARLHAASVSS